MVNDAFLFLHQMRKMLYPDNITLCTLLPGVVKDRHIEDAFKIAKSFVHQVRNQTDNSFWRDLIEGILCDAKIDQSTSLVERLIVDGLCRNDSVLIPLIKVMCKHKKALDAHERFVKFTSSFGIQPTLEAYYVLIEGFLDVHLTEMAWGLFKEIKTVGCAPDVFTYNLLLDDLGKSGRVDEIFELYEEMLSRGCKPNTITHNIVIDGLVKSNGRVINCRGCIELVAGMFEVLRSSSTMAQTLKEEWTV
ncbi:Pentatricopeptide repeat-containing protein [Camellia lanceoleosa]|uniref:Pentatricopeptide repeat-containing protein n=1 Tax=Camellia lanceoleosa TaxID=1840588 RepID=A0ACC0FHW4_9ERIC|nr:Pentatricopeptide repeat-containing protein [Camellia lanceoleosa]